MSNYGSSTYGLSKYGATPRLSYSVEPMSLVVLDYQQTLVSWQIASGDFSRVRLVRNQNSYSEHAEDGVIVYDVTSTTIPDTLLNDGINSSVGTAIVPGKPIYYTMFLFVTASKVWVQAGKVGGIVPSDHGSQANFINTLPRVFTTEEQSPLAEPSTTSDLYSFTSGLSFTVDEFLTYIDLLNPDHTLISTPAALIPLEQAHRGLLPEPSLPLKNQKSLIREAIYMYTHKGTAKGLGTYVEALTGYAPTVTVSNNLLLTVQDSTFYNSIGNWTATGATIVTSTDTAATPMTVSTAIDETYTGKVTTTTSSSSITLGTSSPITRGVPVTPGITHTLSALVKSPASAGTVTPQLTFYDRSGNIIGTAVTGTAVSANNTWKSVTLSARPPKHESQALTGAVGNGSSTVYTTSLAHTYAVGATVIVSGFSASGANTTTSGVTITSTTSNTFTVSSSYNGTTSSGDTGYSVNTETTAAYAGITFKFSAAGVFYVDMVCLQQGSSTTYSEARAIDIYLNANKTNYINNPSFETNVTDGWTKTGSATVTQDTSVSTLSYSGLHSAKIVATGSWSFTSNIIPLQQGLYHTLSALVKNSANISVTFTGYDQSMTPTGHTDTYGPFPASSSWTKITATDLVDAVGEPNVAYYTVSFSGGAGTFYLDCVQFERAPFATEYFDGSLPAIFGAVWTGTANNSATDLYYSKAAKIARLVNTLKDWVPENSFWRVRTSAGVESNNLQV